MLGATIQVLILSLLSVFIIHMILTIVHAHHSRTTQSVNMKHYEVNGDDAQYDDPPYDVLHVTAEEELMSEDDTEGNRRLPKHNKKRRPRRNRQKQRHHVDHNIHPESITEEESTYLNDTQQISHFSNHEASLSPSTHKDDKFESMEDQLKEWMLKETSNLGKVFNNKDDHKISTSKPVSAMEPHTSSHSWSQVNQKGSDGMNSSADGQSSTSIDSLFAKQQIELQKAHEDQSPTQSDVDKNESCHISSNDVMQLQVATIPHSTTDHTTSSSLPGNGIPDISCDGKGYTNPMNADDLGGGLKAFDTAMGSFAAF